MVQAVYQASVPPVPAVAFTDQLIFVAMPALLTAQSCEGNVHLIIGSGSLASSRCIKSLECGALPILVCPENADLHFTLTRLLEEKRIQWTKKEFEEEDLSTLGRHEVEGYVDAVFVTQRSKSFSSEHISQICKRLRVSVNVVDAPSLCTFTLLSTYSDGPLQIGITTSGRGCKLSSRIRREIAASLPPNFGQAIEKLGMVRKKIWEQDRAMQNDCDVDNTGLDTVEDEDSANQKHTFNTLIQPTETEPAILRTRRMRWLSQICEYWPLKRLADISDADITNILEAYKATAHSTSANGIESVPSVETAKSRSGTITLAGSGPGHPSLLTIATRAAIESAHFILADKLVPAEILALIPRRTPVHIARKFPGNADAAQEELLALGLAAMKDGQNVLRLKQGDPYLYGRGAEEVTFFRKHGFEPRVIPGVTSALSAPLFAGVPVTHRAVADQVVICTGTGRKGAAPEPPAYKKSKTVVFLMALHRLDSLVQSLTCTDNEVHDQVRTPWPKETPCAVIERASCPDQRVIRSTLGHVCRAVEVEGSRPPGLIVVGWACEVLHKPINGQPWSVEEGFRALDEISGPAGEMQILDELQLRPITESTTILATDQTKEQTSTFDFEIPQLTAQSVA